MDAIEDRRDQKVAGGGISPGADVEELDATALAASVGRRMRRLRQEAGLTLLSVAQRCNLSQPFLSQLENGRTTPSLITLHKVAAVLGTNVQELLSDEGGMSVSLVRRNDGMVYQLTEGVTVRFLTRGRRSMEPNEVIADPGTDGGSYTEHAGDELIYVLEGHIEFEVGTRRVEYLDPGDTFCYRAAVPHRWRNVGKGRARFLIISSPPSF